MILIVPVLLATSVHFVEGMSLSAPLQQFTIPETGAHATSGLQDYNEAKRFCGQKLMSTFQKICSASVPEQPNALEKKLTLVQRCCLSMCSLNTMLEYCNPDGAGPLFYNVFTK